jgi:protein phosphatase 1L
VSYGRVLGELGVTRAFGDINYKHPHNKGNADFVSVQPHIKVIDLQPCDEFLIMASDGLWDVVSHYGIHFFFYLRFALFSPHPLE